MSVEVAYMILVILAALSYSIITGVSLKENRKIIEGCLRMNDGYQKMNDGYREILDGYIAAYNEADNSASYWKQQYFELYKNLDDEQKEAADTIRRGG